MISWSTWLAEQCQQAYMQDILAFVAQRRKAGVVVYPEQQQIFSAFSSTPLDQVKVVILGQDPYHGPDQAHGLCFSVLPSNRPPPSLVNIYKELARDIEGFQIPAHGYLQSWAQQGVLLLNTILTVEQGKPNAHQHLGWQTLTDRALQLVSEQCRNVVFLLWGKPAQQKSKWIDSHQHHILTAAHPSPLSAYRGFVGCQHFSKTNAWLQAHGKTPIDWRLTDIHSMDE